MDLTIDRYEVRRLIGQGAMGKIYLAADPKIGRDVAIKVLTAPREDKQVRSRFRLEARAIAALKHPNIVELYDYSGEDAADLFLVMEYVPGRTLQDYIAERGPMSEPTTLCVCHELTLALEAAHANSVVHRDIKPDNVLLHEGRVVLTDFGIVKQIAGGFSEGWQTRHTKVLGTPGFMAPEQFSGKGIDTRTDLFAMGAVLYHLSTGNLPFAGSTIDEVVERVRSGRFVDPREYSPLASEGFCKLVGDLLETKPKDRLQTATELRTRILDLLNAHGVTEIRRELTEYQKNPTSYAIEQRERGLEVLMRDLKIAVKDRDERRVQAIIKRMQTIAPIEDRMRNVDGLRWDRTTGPRLVDDPAHKGRNKYIAIGAAVGVVVGIFIGLELLIMGILPSGWVAWLEQLTEAVGISVGP